MELTPRTRQRLEDIGETLRRLRRLTNPCRVCGGRGVRGVFWFRVVCQSCSGSGVQQEDVCRTRTSFSHRSI